MHGPPTAGTSKVYQAPPDAGGHPNEPKRRFPVFQLSQIRERMAFPVPYYPTTVGLDGSRLDASLAAEGDAHLLDAVAAGDADALALLFDRHGAAVLGLLTRMLGRGGEADEVLQEVFLWLWKHPRRYDA